MKKILHSILLLAAIVLVPVLAFSQRTITGQITDAETGETLIGANILVAGTATGTISDIDGTFELELPAGFDVLSLSYTGYASQDIKVGASNVINVKMAG